MTNVKGYFMGNYLKADGCKGGEICTIKARGEMEEIRSPEGEIKSVLNYKIDFEGIEKTFTPNKANGLIMIEAWGEDDEKWTGKQFRIRLTTANVFGKIKKSIIVEPIVIKTEKVQ